MKYSRTIAFGSCLLFSAAGLSQSFSELSVFANHLELEGQQFDSLEALRVHLTASPKAAFGWIVAVKECEGHDDVIAVMEVLRSIQIDRGAEGPLAASYPAECDNEPDRMNNAFLEHYTRHVGDQLPGSCYVHLTLTADGQLSSIDARRCSSDETRAALYERLAAAVPFPPVPGNDIWVSTSPTPAAVGSRREQD